MLIDFHTHAFPDSLAAKAMASLGSRIDLKPLTNGTIGSLIEKMDQDGVDYSVVCNIATNAHQNIKVNSFALETKEKHSDRLFPLGSIHPDFERPYDELERLYKSGIKGIKIHPDYMSRMIDDPSFDEIFDLCAQFDMFVITHAGFDVYSPDKIWATPDAILNRLKRSPRSKLIGAHFGGNTLWQEVADKLAGKNLWIDTSLGVHYGLPKELAADILTRHDPEKILFGSDCPWFSPKLTFEYIDSLTLPDLLKEKIFSSNAMRLLGM